jgi:hypothetical protein
MADNRLDGIATFLASSFGRGDVTFLLGKNDLSLILHAPVAAITKINIDFLWRCPVSLSICARTVSSVLPS